MKLLTGRFSQKDCVHFSRNQSDGHVQSLVGLQEIRTKFGFSSSLKNCRDGYHVMPIDTETYTHAIGQINKIETLV